MNGGNMIPLSWVRLTQNKLRLYICAWYWLPCIYCIGSEHGVKGTQRIFFSNWFSFWFVQRNGSIQLKDHWLSLDRSENICLYNTNVKNLANGPVSRVTSRYGGNMTPSSKLRLTPGFQGCFGLFGPKIVLQSSWLDWAIWAALLTEHLWEGGSV